VLRPFGMMADPNPPVRQMGLVASAIIWGIAFAPSKEEKCAQSSPANLE